MTEYITPADGWDIEPQPKPRNRFAEVERANEAKIVRKIIEERLLKHMPQADWARIGNPTWEARVQPRIRAAAEKWTPDLGNLVVSAKSGTGKTFGYAALAHRLVAEAVAAATRKHIVVLAHWTDCYHLVAAARRHPLGEGMAPEVENACKASLLFLDELGHEPSGGRDKYDPILWEIIDTRYREHRPTLVTSGMRPAELKDRYGAAFFRRLIEPKGFLLDLWEDA